MESGSLNSSEVATLALLQSRGFGGGGYGVGGGYGYGGVNGHFAADGSVINTNVGVNREFGKVQTDRIVDNQMSNADRITDAQKFVADIAGENRISDKFADQNLALATALSGIDRRFSDLSLQINQCCCDLKAGQATIEAKVDSAESVRVAVEQAKTSSKLDLLVENL